jgi:AcrR family transcriptional regulator
VTKHLSPQDRRRQLLDATGRLFVRDGLGGITMVAVASEAGVSRRLLYDQFSDLRTLLRDYVWDALARQIPLGQAAGDSTTGAPPEAVRQVFDQVLRFDDEQRAIVELIRARPQNADLALVWATVDLNLLVRWRRFEQFADMPDAAVLVIGRLMLSTVLDLVGAVHAGTLSPEAGAEAAIGVGIALATSFRAGATAP